MAQCMHTAPKKGLHLQLQGFRWMMWMEEGRNRVRPGICRNSAPKSWRNNICGSSTDQISCTLPKTDWKSPCWKGKSSSKPSFFGFHVSFQGCINWVKLDFSHQQGILGRLWTAMRPWLGLKRVSRVHVLSASASRGRFVKHAKISKETQVFWNMMRDLPTPWN